MADDKEKLLTAMMQFATPKRNRTRKRRGPVNLHIITEAVRRKMEKARK